ncbi:MAG: excisionase family DNA-binding protein [Nitrospira sp.]|nr:excisionase family DNA-binding protein [Nitrospira sp.]
MDALQQRQIATAEEVARGLKIGKSTVYMLAKTGQIPSLVIGKKGVRFDWDAVIEALRK